MHSTEICIAGAGIIGLSLALELHYRGARVTVLDQGRPLAEASTAAAGMLAAGDPDNPLELRPLSRLSISLYPDFLDRIESLSGIHVPFHTSTTLQALPSHLAGKVKEQDTLAPATLGLMLPQLKAGDHRFILLAEESLDPRELAGALLAAVKAAYIKLRPHTAIRSIRSVRSGVEVETSAGMLTAGNFVDCTGAWSVTSHLLPHLRVTPRKGQLLAISLPTDLPLHVVVRTPEIYVVPRTTGPSLKRAVIGATVEDVGYDKTVHAGDIARLRSLAATLLPQLGGAPEVETWSGLRPTTEDRLPILGALRCETNQGVPDDSNLYIATGHYRNGILLAPATAHLMAQVLAGETPSIDLGRFSPDRVPAQEH
jgi:glycine oxidase